MIPTSITTALTSLQTQVAAALPLDAASRATIQALQLNAAALVAAIDTAVANAATLSTSGTIGVVATIDTWAAPTDPEGIIAGVQAMLVSATDQWNLSVMRGLVGRVATNLDQLGPVPMLQPSTIYSPLPPAPKLPPPESGQSFLGRFAKADLRRFRFNQ
jgi:hypothetical protein